MTILKTTCLSIAATSLLAMTPAAYANSIGGGGGAFGPFGGTSTAGFANNSLVGGTGGNVGSSANYVVLGGSETASRYFRKGVKSFEKGDLEKSEYAFKGVLRAHGSRSMDGLTLHYLTLISDQQGDEVQKKKYAQAYYKLTEK